MLEDDKNFYFICEYLPDGDLNDRLQKVGTFDEQQASIIIHQLL